MIMVVVILSIVVSFSLLTFLAVAANRPGKKAQSQTTGAAPAGAGQQQTQPQQNQPQKKKSWKEDGKKWGKWFLKGLATLVLLGSVIYIAGLLLDFWAWPDWATWEMVRDQWEDHFGGIQEQYYTITFLFLLLLFFVIPKGDKK